MHIDFDVTGLGGSGNVRANKTSRITRGQNLGWPEIGCCTPDTLYSGGDFVADEKSQRRPW